ncbi:E3 ubiquitin ligase BIG BROTHER, partial [Mucuna pruriens]
MKIAAFVVVIRTFSSGVAISEAARFFCLDCALHVILLSSNQVYILGAAESYEADDCRLLVWEKGSKMSWNPHMEVHYNSISYPYNTAGSFIEYFEGLTYEHVNFIFSGASHAQESSYPSNSSFYKFGLSEPENTSYYRYSHGYEVSHHEPLVDEYRRPSENSLPINEQTAAVSTEWVEGGNTDTRDNSIECPRRHHSNSNDYQVIWQDNIDPDNMTYEELLELGEAVGTQSRGLTQEQISSLPVSKYKCGFFLRKKSRDERCVICQMEYKRGDKRITLPCKHVYHASCGNRLALYVTRKCLPTSQNTNNLERISNLLMFLFLLQCGGLS